MGHYFRTDDDIMGHASIETTMRYVRFAGELSESEIAALDLAS
jgi:hypothetical protein